MKIVETTLDIHKEVCQALEEKMLCYTDIMNISVKECREPMVNLASFPLLKVMQLDEEMLKYTGKEVYVRKQVANKLISVAQRLQKELPDYQLLVYYGYRALAIQKQNFEKLRRAYQTRKKHTTKESLYEAVHRHVAVPELAGHPTGGAVDLTLVDKNGQMLDMGSQLRVATPETYTFYPFISKKAWYNRQLLRRLMMAEEFAPYDGEWWHFSYGDVEWAKYYNKKNAIYKQIEFSAMCS